VQLPSVGAVRPSHCPGCGVASRPVGRALVLHGHGVRTRQQLGPRTAKGAPTVLVLTVRRYQCQDCGCVCQVLPRGVLPRKHYSGGAIALALALWAYLRQPAPAVRARVSPFKRIGPSAMRGWHSLLRWSRGPPWPVESGQGGPRVRALEVARYLLALSPLTAAEHSVAARAFAAAQQTR